MLSIKQIKVSVVTCKVVSVTGEIFNMIICYLLIRGGQHLQSAGRIWKNEVLGGPDY